MLAMITIVCVTLPQTVDVRFVVLLSLFPVIAMTAVNGADMSTVRAAALDGPDLD